MKVGDIKRLHTVNAIQLEKVKRAREEMNARQKAKRLKAELKALKESMQIPVIKEYYGEVKRYKVRQMEINFQNARCTYDTNKNLYVNKKKSKGKVDEVVALINAMYLLQQDYFLNVSDFVIQLV